MVVVNWYRWMAAKALIAFICGILWLVLMWAAYHNPGNEALLWSALAVLGIANGLLISLYINLHRLW